MPSQPGQTQTQSKQANRANENEGEGNRTAARNYDAATQKYVESGRVDSAAKAAEEALEGAEGKDLRAAEEKAKHVAPKRPLTDVKSGDMDDPGQEDAQRDDDR